MPKALETSAIFTQDCLPPKRQELLPVRLFRVPWLIPGWAQAQTWGRWILIRQDVTLTLDLLAHELAHVQQWQTLGKLRFLWRYAWGLVRYGYWRHPLEQAARAATRESFYQTWAALVLQQANLTMASARSQTG